MASELSQPVMRSMIALWDELKTIKPLVQCITNYVSMDLMANSLNAIGASPAMVHCLEEVEEFVKHADALVINVGTLSADWVASMEQAATVASSLGKPWVLDPVGAGATTFRTDAIRRLLRLKPTLVRGNATEILALSGALRSTRGVDSTVKSGAAVGAIMILAKKFNTVVAVSGQEDFVTDGERVLRVINGVEMLTKITAAGCSVTAVMAAFISVGRLRAVDALHAAAFGLGVFGLAGELASRDAKGPGSLRVCLLDELYSLTEGKIWKGIKIKALPMVEKRDTR